MRHHKITDKIQTLYNFSQFIIIERINKNSQIQDKILQIFNLNFVRILEFYIYREVISSKIYRILYDWKKIVSLNNGKGLI